MNDEFLKDAIAIVDGLTDEQIAQGLADAGIGTAPVSAPLDTQALPPPHWAKTQSYSVEQVQSIIAPYAERIDLLTHNLLLEREYVRKAREKVAQRDERIRHLEREYAELREASLAMSAELGKFQGAEYLAKIDGRTAGTAPGELEKAAACWCHACNKDVTVGGWPYSMTTFIVCPDCGNKRCPKASDHALTCTGSNEPGQPGSIYAAAPTPINSGMEEA